MGGTDRKLVRKRIVALALGLAIATGLGLVLLRDYINSWARAVPVEVTLSGVRSIVSLVRASGEISSLEEATIKSISSGVVKTLAAGEGQQVERGALLAVLYNPQLKDEFDEAWTNFSLTRLELKAVEEEYKQKEKLYAAKAVSKRELLDTQIRYEKFKLQTLKKAQTAYLRAKEKLEAAKIRSPVEGEVVKIFIGEGDSVEAGKELFKVANLRKPTAKILVDEFDIGWIKKEQPVLLEIETYPGKPMLGQVYKISPLIEKEEKGAGVKKVLVICIIGDPRGIPLKYGSSVAAKFVTGRKEKAPAVPREAVLTREGKSFVFAIEGRRAKRKDIELGMVGENFVEVLKGLPLGTKVITRGSLVVKHGDYVNITKFEEK